MKLRGSGENTRKCKLTKLTQEDIESIKSPSIIKVFESVLLTWVSKLQWTGWLPKFANKVLLKYCHDCLQVIYGSFCTARADLTSCDRDFFVPQAENVYHLTFSEKVCYPLLFEVKFIFENIYKKDVKRKMIINSYSRKHSVKSNIHNDFF